MARFQPYKPPKKITLDVLLRDKYTIGRINGVRDIGKATLYLVDSFPEAFTKRELRDLFNEYNNVCLPKANNRLEKLSEEEKQKIEHLISCEHDVFIGKYLKDLNLLRDLSRINGGLGPRRPGANIYNLNKVLDNFFAISKEENNTETRNHFRRKFYYTHLVYYYEIAECIRKLLIYSAIYEGIDPNKTAYQVTLIDIQIYIYKRWKSDLSEHFKHRHILKYRLNKIALKGLKNLKFKQKLISNLEPIDLYPNEDLEMEIADFVPTFENWKNHIKWVDESIGTEALD